jgi:uncharacterized phage infection (PIP) family protein YhgE
MLPLFFTRFRTAIIGMSMVISFSAVSATDEPIASEATSKVIANIAHTLIKLAPGGTVIDTIISPYIDDTLVKYLSGDPKKIQPILVNRQTQISKKLQDSAESDMPVLKAQLELIQKELTTLEALQQPHENNENLTQMSSQINNDAKQMVNAIDNRSTQLANVESKLDDATERFHQANTSESPASNSPSPSEPRSPSFDCGRSRYEDEKLICQNASLSDIDGRLGDVYKELKNFYSPSEAQELKNEEISWIVRRRQQLTTDCKINNAVDMPCAMELWKERITQLEAQLQNAKARRL